MGTLRAIVIHREDNVATTLHPLIAGMKISVEVQGQIRNIELLSDIPAGHKFALRDMEEGALVIKYGEAIGQTTAKINRGEHVHVHNVVSPSLARGSR